MVGIRIFSIHRPWEDWVSMLLGVLIGLSPWLAGHPASPAIEWNAVLIGVIVLGLAQLEYVSLKRWEEVFEIVVGLWLVASPFIFGYVDAGSLAYWHYILGALVAFFGLLELWQDWRLTDAELAQHGR